MNQAARDRERRRAAKRRRRTNRLARGGKVSRVLRTSELYNGPGMEGGIPYGA